MLHGCGRNLSLGSVVHLGSITVFLIVISITGGPEGQRQDQNPESQHPRISVVCMLHKDGREDRQARGGAGLGLQSLGHK